MPIDILYKLFIQTSESKNSLLVDKDICLKGTGTIKLQYFENAINITDIFVQLQNVQRLVEYWYEDDELYHLIQYSATYLKMTFSALTDLWFKNNRNTFVAELKKKILANDYVSLVLQEKDNNGNVLSEEYKNFNENWYDGDNTDMMPIMVLSDIVRILKSKNSKFPIANLDPSHFVSVKEDKEHIFPQTPLQKGYSLRTLKNYIEVAFNCGYAHKMGKERILALADYYYIRLQANEDFRVWFNKKMTSKPIIPLNSLGNVCLLQDKVNRSYGNDFFAQKHFDIVQKSANGEYIRPHVLDAFTKVMANEIQRHDFTYMQRWTKDDIFARRQYIVSQLKNYLLDK